MFTIHNKRYYRDKIIKSNPSFSLIFNKKHPVVIFGAARLGKSFLSKLRKVKVEVASFIDNNKTLQGMKIDNVPIISLKEAESKYRLSSVIIASVCYGTEIYDLLEQKKFTKVYSAYYLNLVRPKIFAISEYHNFFNALFRKENQKEISKVYKLLKDKESRKVFIHLLKFRLTANTKYIMKVKSKSKLYYDTDVMSLSKDEVFADCGAYDGDSVESFLKATKKRFNKVYSFEPDEINYKKLKEKVKKFDPSRIIPINRGVYKKTGIIEFKESGTVDSKIPIGSRFYPSSRKIKKDGINYISVISLDDFFRDKQPPTLIKMDIEGAEIDALKGTKKLLKKYKPKLAISAYHKADDLWKIVLLIKLFNNSYKFYLRHYGREVADTICYAV